MIEVEAPFETGHVYIGGLRVARQLVDFVEKEALPASGLNLDPATFWAGVERLVMDVMPENRRLLEERDRIQADLDHWHRSHRRDPWDPAAYRAHLEEIGYLLPEPEIVKITTEHVDPEVAEIAGPQLVVPVSNARYALNASNARWGSLYDALYGTDAISGQATSSGYDAERGARVIAEARRLLDDHFPLEDGSHADATGYAIRDGALEANMAARATRLADGAALRGYSGDPASPTSVLLRKHGLHVEIGFDQSSPIAATDNAGVSDVLLESAITTIVDFEDSVAVVDAADKVAAYRNWLGLNRGDLEATFEKGGRTVTRGLGADRRYLDVEGNELILRGRALLFVRNVGHLMTTDALLDVDGAEVGEGVLDAVITTLCALPGIDPANPRCNSPAGSIYIVKPKMHGPEEVAFGVRLFERVERLLGLAPNTIKLGLMDEERRTSVNLKACIAEASARLVFINTGFLDRSGDEIHTSMEAGPVARKADLKTEPWISAYEDQNVDIGIEVGLSGRGQIGKGMWVMPDQMADMLAQKVAHPLAGASTAWVPSPTAATLHALHYLNVDVRARQSQLAGRRRSPLDALLTIPLGDMASWDDAARQEELDNNVQSLLGYVVRWVDQGIGCSKVPDIHEVALMEDRATLRISSQLLANWLRHGVVGRTRVEESLKRMARLVDRQNIGDPDYRPMAPEFDGPAFRAAWELVFKGASQPNGYTEPILHRRRRQAKAGPSTVEAVEVS